MQLDRTFVGGLTDDDPRDWAVVAAGIDLARRLGLVAVAEGVETRGQLEELRELGCHRAQGHFFASPQPAEAVAALLAEGIRAAMA